MLQNAVSPPWKSHESTLSAGIPPSSNITGVREDGKQDSYHIFELFVLGLSQTPAGSVASSCSDERAGFRSMICRPVLHCFRQLVCRYGRLADRTNRTGDPEMGEHHFTEILIQDFLSVSDGKFRILKRQVPAISAI